MFNGNDINEQNLNQMYDMFSKQQQSHMNTIKTSKELDEKREKYSKTIVIVEYDYDFNTPF